MASNSVVSIQERIAQSRRASAVERAWNVAKSLEDKHQIAGLKWVSPKHDEKGLSRPIDFASEYPDVSVLMPLQLSMNILAPANVLVPGEDLKVNWTMPLLVRARPKEDLSQELKAKMGVNYSEPKVRPKIDVVSFLPFPRADAPEEERFTPEFYLHLNIGGKTSADKFYAVLVRFQGRCIDQFVNPNDPNSILLFADPHHQTLFRAQMLVNLPPEVLVSIPENSGTLDIFIYRVAKATSPKIPRFSIDDILGKKGDILGGDRFRLGDLGDFTRGGGSTFGDTPFADLRRNRRPGFGLIQGEGQRPKLPPPAEAKKEVGDVHVTEGTAGQKVETESVSVSFDSEFAVQQVSIRMLGVREAAREAAIEALDKIASE